MPHPLCTVRLECCTHVTESLYPLYISFQLHGMVFPPPSGREILNCFSKVGICTSFIVQSNHYNYLFGVVIFGVSICVGNITVYGPIRMLQCRLPSKLCNTDLIGPYADKCEAY